MFSFKPLSKKFNPSWKVKQLFEKSKADQSDFEPRILWDLKNPPKPIWEGFNVVSREDNTNSRGIIIGENSDDFMTE